MRASGKKGGNGNQSPPNHDPFVPQMGNGLSAPRESVWVNFLV